MTVKNGLPYLKDSVKSVLDQSVDCWELVIVDDGSSDGTKEYLENLRTLDSRVKVFITDGLGRGKALNFAVSKTSFDIISNLDADDLIHKEKTFFYLFAFRKNPDLSFLCSKTSVFSSQKERVFSLIDNEVSIDRSITDITEKLKSKSYIEHSSVAMRKQVFVVVGGYSENRSMQIDYDLWFRWGLKGYRINKLLLSLSAKRLHPSQSFEKNKRFRYLVSAYNLKMMFLENSSASFSYKVLALFYFVYGILPSPIRKVAKKIYPR